MKPIEQRDPLAITVMIPSRNYGYFLRDAIDSALAETRPGDVVLVIDDGSTDDTPCILDEYGARIRRIRTPGVGVGEVRELALREYETPWFFNLDADNMLLPGALERLRAAAHRVAGRPEVAFLYPSMRRVGLGFDYLVPAEPLDLARLKIRNYLDMNSLVRVDVARLIGFDNTFEAQDDYDFFLSACARGYRGEPVPDAVVLYRMHSGSISQSVRRIRSHRSTWKKITTKHAGLYSADELRQSRHERDNRIVLGVIKSRLSNAPLGTRLRQLCAFARANIRHAEIINQARYTIAPQRYLARTLPAGDVLYLFPRHFPLRESLDSLEAGSVIPAREGLLGFDRLKAVGARVDHNLRYEDVPRIPAPDVSLAKRAQQLSRLSWQARRARVMVAASAEMGLAALQAAHKKGWEAPIIIRWEAESRTEALLANSDTKRWLRAAHRILLPSAQELNRLSAIVHDPERLRVVAPVVDTNYWVRREALPESLLYDAICIGEEDWLDQEAIIDMARAMPDCTFAIHLLNKAVTPADSRDNLHVFGPIPYPRMRTRLLSARCVILPVQSGKGARAQIWLLRALSLEQPVLVIGDVATIPEEYRRRVPWAASSDRFMFIDQFRRLYNGDVYTPEERRHLREAIERTHGLDQLFSRLFSESAILQALDNVQLERTKR